MNSVLDLLGNPLVWKILLAYWIFSAFIGALPTPNEKSALWYVFVFRFGHLLGGNVNRAAVALKVPGAADPDPKP